MELCAHPGCVQPVDKIVDEPHRADGPGCHTRGAQGFVAGAAGGPARSNG